MTRRNVEIDGERIVRDDARSRRRRSPAQAEREILDAAEALLRVKPFRDLTVDDVMARTTLSRPSFYVYFRDRHGLITRILERVGAELFEIDRGWLGGDTPPSGVRETLAAGAAFFAREGPVLRAIADAAANDPEIERLYRFGLIARFAGAVADRVRRGAAAGEMDPALDPDAVGLALVLMTERYLLETVARDPNPGPGRDAVVEALTIVWTKTLYGPGDQSDEDHAGADDT